jgi:hypothetical protein
MKQRLLLSSIMRLSSSEFNTLFQAEETSRSNKFEKSLTTLNDKVESNISDYSNNADTEFKTLSVKVAKIIEVLTKFQDDASKVYGVTINTLQGGAYSSYANEERKTANSYRTYASILMLLGVTFLVAPELYTMYTEESYVFDWKKVLGRIPLSLVVFVPAFYFARESGKHRTNEVVNRRRQHILTTLDPYIELMDETKADDLKMHVAKTVFSETSVATNSDEKETGNIISQLSNLVSQLKGK